MSVSTQIWMDKSAILSTQSPNLFMTLNPIINANGGALFPAMIQAVGDLALSEGSSWFINMVNTSAVNTTASVNDAVTTSQAVSIQNTITCGWLGPGTNGSNVIAIQGNPFYWDLVPHNGFYALGLPNSGLFVSVNGSEDKTPLMLTSPASTNSSGGDMDLTHMWNFQFLVWTDVDCP